MIARDTAALGEFYQRHSPTIYALCLRVVGDAHDAEDVLVDVFHEFWGRVEAFDTSRGSPIGLLVTLARCRAIDRRRSRRTKMKLVSIEDPQAGGNVTSPTSPLRGDSIPPDAQLAGRQQREQIRAALSAIDPQQRRVIECVYYDGMTHSEIAEALDKPLGTVKTWIRQGLLRLHDVLMRGSAGSDLRVNGGGE
jgi:RNA polymerase sigma-70 factor (ECF subfamily)